MHKTLPFLVAVFAILTESLLQAEDITGWAKTEGGDKGTTIEVVTLKAYGKGSLGDAIKAKGARKIVFKVGGTIDLEGKTISIAEPGVTIAGETAPEPGITLKNGGLYVKTHDVILRHLRVRPGVGERTKDSGWQIDGLSTGQGAVDVIVDHCSFSWATDENLTVAGPRFEGKTPDEWRENTSHRVTFSHNIIAEALDDATHPKGPHSKGTLVHDNTSDIAIIGNLYISNVDRNPLFKGGARGVIVNNVIQNPGKRIVSYALVPSEWGDHPYQRGAIDIMGNIARRGPSTQSKFDFLISSGPLDVFLQDNLYFDQAGKPLKVDYYLGNPLPTGSKEDDFRLSDKPLNLPEGLTVKPSSDVLDWVLSNAGARPWARDEVDARLVKEARNGGGKILDHEPPSEVRR